MYKKRKEQFLLLNLLLILLVNINIYSVPVKNGEQKLVPSGSWVYDALDTLFMESGCVTLATSTQPLSITEIRLNLNELDYDILSESGKSLYNEVLSYLDSTYLAMESGVVSIGIDPAFKPEVFFKTNKEINWVHDYKQRQKAFLLPVHINASRYVTLSSDFFFGQNYSTSLKNEVYTNIPYDGSSFSAEFPQNAGLSAGAFIHDTPFLNFQIGSGSLNMFKTQMESVAFSDSMEGLNYARLSIFSPKIRYTLIPMQLDVNKYLYMHQLEIRPFKRVSFSVVEGVLVNAPFELRFINPLMVFHNYSSWLDYEQYDIENGNKYPSSSAEGSHIGSQFAIYVNANPWKYLRIYGIFTFNQFQTFYERENWPEESAKIPDSLAYQAGIESSVPLKKGYINVGIEGLYTSPWMYICNAPEWSFYRQYDELVGSGVVKNWTGSSFGPDAVVAQAKIGYDSFGRKWNISALYRFCAHGEQSFSLFEESDYYPTTSDKATWITPHGITEYKNTIALDGSYKVFPWFTLKGQTAVCIVENNKNIEGKNETGFEISLSVSLNRR